MAFNVLKSMGVLLGTMSALTAAAPVVVESLGETPAGWVEVRTPVPDQLIKLSIGLQSDNHELFERTLYSISDPSHEHYGRHVSRDEAKALLNPRQEAIDSVKRWLSEAGVPDNQVRDDGQWLHVRTTVTQAEGLLNTRFGVFARDNEHVVRTKEYSVPAEVRDHIVTIQPTTFFNTIKKRKNMKRSPAAELVEEKRTGSGGGGYGGVNLDQCKTVLTPACLRKIYKMPNDYEKANKKSLYGIVGFNEQAAQYVALEEFLRLFAPDQRGANFSVALANGGSNPQEENPTDIMYPSGEANLDIQYAVSLGYKVPVRYIAVGGENHDFNTDLDLYDSEIAYIEPWLEFATYLLNLPDKDLPQVVSVSYGVNEQHVPKTYAKEVCNMFGQLGTRGVSVVVASGDFGPGFSCQSNDGKNTTKFLPGFPAACPYVTSVGGTESNSPEVATYLSGGGFSEYWSRPNWQDKAIDKYLRKYGDEWKGYYNKNGRAYPDVAALASGHQIINHGIQQTTGGTSAAAPVFGAMIALINNERFKDGKPALGFLNPWIWKHEGEGFTDITQGKSVGCEGTSLWGLPSPNIPNAGWRAVKGWDPVTGWGTPIFNELMDLAT
ncbi:Fc.00g098010.m01.CDS01 [Cosmosporella sp. VM-42]